MRGGVGELPGTLEPVRIPLHEEIETITQLIMLPEATAGTSSGSGPASPTTAPDVRARLLAGLFLPVDRPRDGAARAPLGARGVRARARRLRPARRAGDADHGAAAGCDPAAYRLELMPYNSAAALLGLPVTVVPCGVVDGLPVGLALTGRRGEDGVPLAAAEALQHETDWHLRRPVDPAPATELYTTRQAHPGRG